MTINHLQGRNTPYPADKHPEVNEKLGKVADAFDLAWLQQAGDHPLQLLWQRQDGLSTNELAWLGDSLERTSLIDGKWTKRAIKTIKEGDQNDRGGAIFE